MGSPVIQQPSDLASNRNREDRYLQRLLGLFKSRDGGGIHARKRQLSHFRDEGFKRRLLEKAARFAIKDLLHALAADLSREKNRFTSEFQELIGLFQFPYGGEIQARRRPVSNESVDGCGGGDPPPVVARRSTTMDPRHTLRSDRTSDEKDDDDDDRGGRPEPEPERDLDLDDLNGMPDFWCYMCSEMVNPVGSKPCLVCPHCSEFSIERVQRPYSSLPRGQRPGPFHSPHSGEIQATRLTGSNADEGLGGLNMMPELQRRELVNLGHYLLLIDVLIRLLGYWYVLVQFRGILFQFDDLIQLLAENDANRYGSPPAAQTAVDALPTVRVSEEQLRSNIGPCSSCLEEFELGVETLQLPCNHIYHPDCILPWLRDHSTCPTCRFQLTTEDDISGNDPPHSTQHVSNNDNEVSLSVAQRGTVTSSGSWLYRRQHVSNNNNDEASSSVVHRGIETRSGTWLYRRPQRTQHGSNDNEASSSASQRGTATRRPGNLSHPHSD